MFGPFSIWVVIVGLLGFLKFLNYIMQSWEFSGVVSPASSSALVCAGYSSLIVLFLFSGVMDVKVARRLMTPWGVDLKLALVYALPRFWYFHCWFCFKWTRNFSLLSRRNISVLRYRSTLSQLTVMFSFLDFDVMNLSAFQISTVNWKLQALLIFDVAVGISV